MTSVLTKSSSLTMQPEIPINQRHHRFFIPSQSVLLKVDAVYFNLPASILTKHSKKWARLINIDQSTFDPDYASLSQGISALDLERFLTIIFPSDYGEYEATSFEEWASILRVAHQWEFTSIVKLSLQKIEPLCSPVDKIVLGKAYNMQEWAIEGRVRLCRRDEPITLDEAQRMGIEEVVNISTIRHHISPPEVSIRIQDSTIRSVLSGELQIDSIKNVLTDIPPPDQPVHRASLFAPLVHNSASGSSKVKRDPTICRALEYRKRRNVLKGRLATLQEQEESQSDTRTKEATELEIQLDELEDEYVELYVGRSYYNPGISCTRKLEFGKFDNSVQSALEFQLGLGLHPDAQTRSSLLITFSPQCKREDSMKQNAKDILECYGIEYKVDDTGITVQLP